MELLIPWKLSIVEWYLWRLMLIVTELLLLLLTKIEAGGLLQLWTPALLDGLVLIEVVNEWHEHKVLVVHVLLIKVVIVRHVLVVAVIWLLIFHTHLWMVTPDSLWAVTTTVGGLWKLVLSLVELSVFMILLEVDNKKGDVISAIVVGAALVSYLLTYLS